MLPELLLASKPVASPALRERVRLIAAAEPDQPRGLPRRRIALAMGLAVVAAAGAAGLAVGLSGHGSVVAKSGPEIVTAAGDTARRPGATAAVLPTAPGRLQDYRAPLQLQVPNSAALSDRTKRAMRIARRLGGFVAKVDLGSHGQSGSALIVLRVPIGRVQDAIGELSALGRIVQQHVVIVDAERKIEVLRKQVQESTGVAREAAQTQLQRELRTARLSTVAVDLHTPPAPVPGPPHRESVAARILEAEGRIALYTMLIAGPILAIGVAIWLAVRALRRRSERRLLDA